MVAGGVGGWWRGVSGEGDCAAQRGVGEGADVWGCAARCGEVWGGSILHPEGQAGWKPGAAWWLGGLRLGGWRPQVRMRRLHRPHGRPMH
eukprot:352120-Chlamydomonas_euryale.AAC.1